MEQPPQNPSITNHHTSTDPLETELQQIWELYDNAYLFQAKKKFAELQERVRGSDAQEKLAQLMEEARYKQLLAECEEGEHLISRLSSEDGWLVTGSHTDVETFYRFEKDTSLHSIKLRGEVAAPLLQVLALINEVDLYRLWLPPLVDDTRELAATRYRKVVYVRARLPWPLAPRDLLTYGYSIDDLAGSGAVLVLLRDLRPADDLAARSAPPAAPGCVRMRAALGGVLLKPLSASRTLVCQLSCVDPQLPYVPAWLLNLCNQQLAPHAFRAFAHAASHPPGSAHAARMQENAALYGDLRARLAALCLEAQP